MSQSFELYSVKQIRTIERLAIDDYGIAEDELMERAGRASFDVMNETFPGVQSIHVFCGGGNNGGDGYVLARIAHLKGMDVCVSYMGDLGRLPNAAKNALNLAIEADVPIHPYHEECDMDADILVDALLGIGLSGQVRGSVCELINSINTSGIPVISIDTPSGLDVDRGVRLGCCVNAAVTVTFIGIKQGMLTADGKDTCGELYCNDIGISVYLEEVAFSAMSLSKHHLQYFLPTRVNNSHKGHYGHVLVIGGGNGMQGAAMMAAAAAYRVGAGLVSVATTVENRAIISGYLPETMCHGVKSAKELTPLLTRVNVCVIGPGLGDDDWAKEMFNAAIACQIPMVIDASALTLLASLEQHDENWVLTPHPGEAATLLKCDTKTIQANRYQSAIELQKNYGGTVVLKGAGTIIQAADTFPWVCPFGNSGMATGGMGDILSGVIAGVIAQGLPLAHAAYCGVLMHALAGDMAANEGGERGMIATDLLPLLRQVANLEEEIEFEWDDGD
jgi:ADP-dependent NAD(P)H-hydrate dehydratase / NAD(P)H-hydrate epimerase